MNPTESTRQTKKLINNPDHIIEEMLEGVLAAHPDHLYQIDGQPRSIIARHGPRTDKVGLMIGGGSGHEPTFLGFVGCLLYTSPSPRDKRQSRMPSSA